MSSAYAAAAVVLSLVIAWTALGLRSLPRVAVRLIAPALLVSGWYYALNQYRYGDPTGSAALFEKLGRPVPAAPVSGEQVSYLVGELFLGTNVGPWSPYLEFSEAPRIILSLVLLSAVAAAVCIAIATSRSDRRVGVPPRLVPSAWVSMLVLSAVPIVLVQQHWSAGGSLHPRYLLPIVPVVTAATALLARLVSRWLPLVIVAAAAVWLFDRVPQAASTLHMVALRRGILSRFGGGPPPAGSESMAVAVASTLTGIGVCMLLVGLAMVTHVAIGQRGLRFQSARPERTNE
jgi:hypothetical protein